MDCHLAVAWLTVSIRTNEKYSELKVFGLGTMSGQMIKYGKILG